MMWEMAVLLEEKEDAEQYLAMLDKGRESFEKKLWNGKCSFP